MRFLCVAVLLAGVTACDSRGRSGDDGGGSTPTVPPACASLCDDSSPACDASDAACVYECAARVQGLSALCTACLVDGAARGGGGCADVECCEADRHLDYASDVFACADSCASDVGPPVQTPDPRCIALCPDGEPGCEATVTDCRAACQARIAGTRALCATCLLEGAAVGGSGCSAGEPCCYDSAPTFATTVEECAAICQR